MATAKKVTKKPVSSKAAVSSKKTPAKTTAIKKPAVKKTASKKTSTRQAELRSFRLAREEQTFTNFQITRQTVYWIVLIAFIILAQLWILKLQVEVASLIEAQQSELQVSE